MKRIVLMFLGLLWLALGSGIAVFSIGYIVAGTELPAPNWLFQILYPISYESFIMKFVHVVGLFVLSLLFVGVGLILFFHGLVPSGANCNEIKHQKE